MSWLWHRRLGHVRIKQLNRLVKFDLVRGLKDVFEKDKLTTLVKLANKLETPHPKKIIMSTSKAFELWIYLGQHNTLALVETDMAL
jgi:hypothetical protein